MNKSKKCKRGESGSEERRVSSASLTTIMCQTIYHSFLFFFIFLYTSHLYFYHTKAFLVFLMFLGCNFLVEKFVFFFFFFLNSFSWLGKWNSTNKVNIFKLPGCWVASVKLMVPPSQQSDTSWEAPRYACITRIFRLLLLVGFSDAQKREANVLCVSAAFRPTHAAAFRFPSSDNLVPQKLLPSVCLFFDFFFFLTPPSSSFSSILSKGLDQWVK